MAPETVVCIIPGPEGADVNGIPDGTRVIRISEDRVKGTNVATLDEAISVSAPADLVFVMGGTRLPEGWLPAMLDARASDLTIAGVGSLSTAGWFHSIGEPGVDERHARLSVMAVSLKLRPRVALLDGPCVLFARSALDLAWPSVPGLTGPIAQIIDLSQRCLIRGMSLVLADEVLASSASVEITQEDRSILDHRYAHLSALTSIRDSDGGPLGQSLDIAAAAVRGERRLSVTIDGSCFIDDIAGTQVHVLELLGALSRQAVSTRVLLLRSCPDWAKERIGAMDGVESLVWEDVDGSTPRTDIVHRPWQIGHPAELDVLRKVGKRLVITQQDLINFRDPIFFARPADWIRFRSMVRVSLDAASHVMFFSKHARSESLAEGLVEDSRSSVVYIGTSHPSLSEDPARPSWLKDDRPFLLCLGNDFIHKNRLFALRVVKELIERHRWQGRLVMVGPQVTRGSSHGDESAFLEQEASVREATVKRGSVAGPEKAWLLSHAAAVLFPSVIEGFGLVPFEAAAAGTPTVLSAQASMEELIPPHLALIEPWDPIKTAEAVHRLLEDPAGSKTLAEQIDAIGKTLGWDATARGAIEAYEQAMRQPLRTRFLSAVPTPLDIESMPPNAALALVGLASRPKLAGPLFWLLGSLYPLVRKIVIRLEKAKRRWVS